ncbi:MAG: RsmB/NOP family class I SAM-dependent RNA methyltransferase, partial [Thermaurantiacus sp.]
MLPAPLGGQEAAGVAARRAAVSLLHAVTVLGRPLDLAFDRACRDLDRGPDRALARALAGQALRFLVDLDRLIDSACLRPLPADSRARQVLRVALAGHLRLGTPPHAMIATALPLVERGPRRLVHGVLSRLLRERAGLPERPTLPEPWASRWEDAWGTEMLEHARAALSEVPPVDLALRDPGATALWVERLGATSLFPGHIRLDGSHDVTKLAGFEDGAWWVQDAAAQLPARLLGDVNGLSVLDACAAPGGKTMQLASRGARVTSVDISAARMQRLNANLRRTALVAEPIVADLLDWVPDAPFDAILVDTPCSATGTFRRHPDVL